MKKPLVIMMGIGYYLAIGDDPFEHLIGVPTDYKNMIKLFAMHWGYPFMYQTDDNKIVYLDKQRLIKKNNKYHTNFKLKWNKDEIGGFVLKSKKIIEAIKPDGLIFIISSHGHRFKSLVDSDCRKYRLKRIFSEYWNTKDGCPYLADKPKIFFLDMCQGTKKPIPTGKIVTDAIPTKITQVHNNDDDDESKQKSTAVKTDRVKNDKDYTIKKMQEEYLDYENFCFIYGNLEDYCVIDAGKEGGYLIGGLKNVLKQRDSSNFELNQVIKMIGNETLRLVKQEKKRNKQDFQPSQSPARQIIECQSSILKYVFFGQSAQHEFTGESQFRYNKYLDFQRRQLKASFDRSAKSTRVVNKYVCMHVYNCNQPDRCVRHTR